jgi:hypothetical protein
MENLTIPILRLFGLFYGQWKYLIAILYILWSFGVLPPFWYFVQRKIWQPRSCTFSECPDCFGHFLAQRTG